MSYIDELHKEHRKPLGWTALGQACAEVDRLRAELATAQKSVEVLRGALKDFFESEMGEPFENVLITEHSPRILQDVRDALSSLPPTDQTLVSAREWEALRNLIERACKSVEDGGDSWTHESFVAEAKELREEAKKLGLAARADETKGDGK